jgi:hypothetical protein
MIVHLAEWYQAASISLDDESLVKRNAAILELTKRLLQQPNMLAEAVVAVAVGWEKVSNTVALKTLVGQTIAEHQPTFVPTNSIHDVEYKVCCALALNELLARNEVVSWVISAQIVASMSNRSIQGGTYWNQIVKQLLSNAMGALHSSALRQRRRANLNLKAFDDIEIQTEDDDGEPLNTAENLWEQLLQPIKDALRTLENNAVSDREELELLWWLYHGTSEKLDIALSDLSVFEAALFCGVEIGERAQVPPVSSVRVLVRRASLTGHSTKAASPKPFADIVLTWQADTLKAILKSLSDVNLNFVRRYPSTCPVLWIIDRLDQAGTPIDWASEWEFKSGLSSSQKWTPNKIAEQIFNERILLRLQDSYA